MAVISCKTRAHNSNNGVLYFAYVKVRHHNAHNVIALPIKAFALVASIGTCAQEVTPLNIDRCLDGRSVWM